MESKGELFELLQDKCNDLNASVRKLAKNGERLAEATKEYKIRLRQEALKMKYDGKMPVSLIELTIHGIPEVAELRFKNNSLLCLLEYYYQPKTSLPDLKFLSLLLSLILCFKSPVSPTLLNMKETSESMEMCL